MSVISLSVYPTLPNSWKLSVILPLISNSAP